MDEVLGGNADFHIQIGLSVSTCMSFGWSLIASSMSVDRVKMLSSSSYRPPPISGRNCHAARYLNPEICRKVLKMINTMRSDLI